MKDHARHLFFFLIMFVTVALIAWDSDALEPSCLDYRHTPAVVNNYNYNEYPRFRSPAANEGNRVWIGAGTRLDGFDLVGPGEWVPLGSLDTSQEILNLVVRGGLAYLANGAAGLTIVDITDPLAPSIVGSLGFPAEVARMVELVGNHACVSCGFYDSVNIIDITNPASPTLVGDMPGFVHCMEAWSEDIVLTIKYGDLDVVDLSDPMAPEVIGHLDFDDDHDIDEIIRAGDFAYTTSDSLHVLDLTDLNNPQILNSVSTGLLGSVNQSEFDASRNNLYLVGENLACYDLTDPTHPVRTCLENLPDNLRDQRFMTVGSYRASGLVVNEGLGLIPYYFFGDGRVVESFLLFWDLTRPQTTQPTGSVPYPDGLSRKTTVTVSGDLLFSTQPLEAPEPGLAIFDITDPSAAVHLADVSTPERVLDVAIAGDYAYAALLGEGIIAVDISDPASPSVVRQILNNGGCGMIPDAIKGISIEGDHGYFISWEFTGDDFLGILDLASPDNPRCISSLKLPKGAEFLAVKDGFAYVTCEPQLCIVDVNDQENPELISTLDLQDHYIPYELEDTYLPSLGGLACQGGTVFVGSMKSGLLAVDVSDPANPSVLGICPLPYSGLRSHYFFYDDIWDLYQMPPRPRAIALAGGLAYVAYEEGGVYAVDISDPRDMDFLGTIPAQFARDVALVGDQVVLAGACDGLGFFPAQCLAASGVPSRPVPSGISHLQDIHPNPFNPHTRIQFTLERTERVKLSVFDVTGRRLAVLADRVFSAGPHEISWDGRDGRGLPASSGTYLVRLETEQGLEARKVELLK